MNNTMKNKCRTEPCEEDVDLHAWKQTVVTVEPTLSHNSNLKDHIDMTSVQR